MARLSGSVGESWRGEHLLLIAALCYSTAGFFTRIAPVEVWSMIFWRNAFGGLALLPLLLAAPAAAPRNLWRFSAREWAVMAVTAVATICYLAAYVYTSVAHVSIIYATSPMLAATMAWLMTRETLSRRTLAAAVVALLGVAVTVCGSRGATGLFGDGLALGMAVLFSLATIVARGRIRVLETTIGAALLTCLLVLPIGYAAGSTFVIGWRDAVWLAAFGFIVIAIALPCYLRGAARVPAGRAMLITSAEMPLGPLWVWLAFGEAPTAVTVLGGAIVAGAVALDLGTRSPGPASP